MIHVISYIQLHDDEVNKFYFVIQVSRLNLNSFDLLIVKALHQLLQLLGIG